MRTGSRTAIGAAYLAGAVAGVVGHKPEAPVVGLVQAADLVDAPDEELRERETGAPRGEDPLELPHSAGARKGTRGRRARAGSRGRRRRCARSSYGPRAGGAAAKGRGEGGEGGGVSGAGGEGEEEWSDAAWRERRPAGARRVAAREVGQRRDEEVKG